MLTRNYLQFQQVLADYANHEEKITQKVKLFFVYFKEKINSIIIVSMTIDYELSEREIEIIRLVATGASNKEIAQTLVISPNTVKVHLRNIFTKLEVASRTEATMVAIRQGWVISPGNQTEDVNEQSKIEADGELTLVGSSVNRRIRLYISFAGIVALTLIIVYLFSLWRDQNNPAIAENPENNPATSESINRWQSMTSIPQSLMGMAFSRYEQSFYLMGGKTSEGVYGEVWIYDVNSDSWHSGQPLDEPVSNVNAAVLGEEIYLPGGVLESGLFSKKLHVFDPRENNWDQRADLPYAVSDYCLAAFEGKLYLFGGWNGTDYLDQVLVYNPESDTWEEFGSMPKAKGACSASVVGGKIHIFGGKDETKVFNDHDLFVPQRYQQNEDPWEKAALMPENRYGMGSGVLADMIYVAGGVNEDGQSLDLLQYFPPKDIWVAIDSPQEPLGEFPAVIPYETRLFTIGGVLNETFSASHQAYQAVYTILVPIVR